MDLNVYELLNGVLIEFDQDSHPDLRVALYLKLPVTLLQPPTQSQQPKFVAALKNVLALPKPVGRFVFDVLGRHEMADSSSIILGWMVVLVAILLFRGLIPLDVLVNWLVGLGGSLFQ